ncbi:LCP family protein [Fredinandcohnia onubensis]|uniref:LCP family protein n=1 Tax=Fredinandcohnia onubensis TaxID=1571209 RepID=UPI000C0BE8BB|nr:LCP family protein [Fredinandcohnia onubensis]
MEDKRVKDRFMTMSDQELRFTKKDRNEVFEKINKIENHTKKLNLVSITRQLAIPTASLLVIGLCILLFIPTIFQGNVTNDNNGIHASGVESQENESFTTLFMVKDENNRIPINLLLSFNEDKKMMKVLSIPRDTYSPIVDKKNGTTLYDKLTHAYIYGSGGAENARTTVSKLFDLPIDYYAVMDLETFSTMIDSVNGIDYDLQEDIEVRALSRVSFEFKKGKNRLNGEEVVALMMAATVGRLGEENQVNLIHAVINQIKNAVPQTLLKQSTTKIEGNAPVEQIVEMEIDSIQSVSLTEGMIDEMINGAYYIKFEKDFLHSVSEELTTFN